MKTGKKRVFQGNPKMAKNGQKTWFLGFFIKKSYKKVIRKRGYHKKDRVSDRIRDLIFTILKKLVNFCAQGWGAIFVKNGGDQHH